MTPVERLRAAIADLEQARYRSTPGPWHKVDGEHYGIVWAQETVADPSDPTGQTPMAEQAEVAHVARSADGELIEMLHRTIDAQLAILRRVLARGQAAIGGGGIERFVWSRDTEALILADAILGRTS